MSGVDLAAKLVEAERLLELTTVGWNRVASYSPAKLATTNWGKARALIDEVEAALAETPPAVAVEPMWETNPGTVAWHTPVVDLPAAQRETNARDAAIRSVWIADTRPIDLVRENYSTYVHVAKTTDPLRTLQSDHDGVCAEVPWPAGAVAAAGDGKLCIVAPHLSSVWEFSFFGKALDGSAGAHRWIKKAWPSPGVFAEHYSMRASGTSQMLGCVTPADVAAGEIRHALAIVAPKQGGKYLTPQATDTGTAYFGGDALHEGARVILEPSFYFEAIGDPLQRMIAEALVVYGGIMVDGSGNLAVQCAGFNGSVKNMQMPLIPKERLRVLSDTGATTK